MLIKSLQAEIGRSETQLAQHRGFASTFEAKSETSVPDHCEQALPGYKRSEKSRINFDVTPKLMTEIRNRAIAQGLTVRAYMLKLLAAEGLDVLDPGLVDGRTLRAANLHAGKSA